MEHERKCSTKEKFIFLILNLSIWLESGIILGFGIVGLTIKDIIPIAVEGHLFICVVAIYVIVGSVGVVTCFVGCFGAVCSNKCIMLSYVTLLGIILILLFTGAIFGFVFGNQLQNNSSDVMYVTLSKYTLEENASDVEKGWDWIQRELQCCGVSYYIDWQDDNAEFRKKQKIPVSCCITSPSFTKQDEQKCISATNKSTYYSSSYIEGGCHTKVKHVFEKYSPIVVGIGGMEAILLIVGITCGGIAFNFL